MSGGHGHDEGEAIVLHQERLLPTMILALAFALVALFGLSVAGAGKFEVVTGKAAYDKVMVDMPKVEKNVPMHSPKATYKDSDGNAHTNVETDEHGHFK